jgi:hypothetical protein
LAVLVLDVHVDGGDWGDGRLPEARDTLTVGDRGNHGKILGKLCKKSWNTWEIVGFAREF